MLPGGDTIQEPSTHHLYDTNDAVVVDTPDVVESGDASVAKSSAYADRADDSAVVDAERPDKERVDGGWEQCQVEAQPDLPAHDSSMDNFVQSLEELKAEVKRFHERAEAQENLISRLHSRVEVLQGGETKKLLKPLSTQLISLFSDLESTASSLNIDTTVDQFRGLLANFSLAVEQMLDNLGLLPQDTTPGDDFEPRLHHAIKKVDTDDPALDRKIAEVLRQGFAEPGEAKPLVPSRVSVYRASGGASASASTPITESGAH